MHQIRWAGRPEIDIFKDEAFPSFRSTLNAEMKRLQSQGIGTLKKIHFAGKACKMVKNYVFVFHAQQVNCCLDRSQVVDVEYSSPHCAPCSKYRSSLRAIYTQRSSDNDPSN